MLQAIAPNIWHMQHEFTANGLRASSRMTVVKLQNSDLWLHSPIPLSAGVLAQLKELGTVKFIVAPNKMHHLFIADCAQAFPQAKLFGAPGLAEKRPDLHGLQTLRADAEQEWKEDLEQVFFEGIPLGNETAWFHRASRTLILTDLCQWWQGELSWPTKTFAHLTGVRRQLNIPRTIKMAIKDKGAAHKSAQKILQWPFDRLVVAHNAIIENNAYVAVEKAFSCLAT